MEAIEVLQVLKVLKALARRGRQLRRGLPVITVVWPWPVVAAAELKTSPRDEGNRPTVQLRDDAAMVSNLKSVNGQ
jgi:hypothetical protein